MVIFTKKLGSKVLHNFLREILNNPLSIEPLTPRLSETIRESLLVLLFFGEHFTANKFQSVTNVHLWPSTLIFWSLLKFIKQNHK